MYAVARWKCVSHTASAAETEKAGDSTRSVGVLGLGWPNLRWWDRVLAEWRISKRVSKGDTSEVFRPHNSSFHSCPVLSMCQMNCFNCFCLMATLRNQCLSFTTSSRPPPANHPRASRAGHIGNFALQLDPKQQPHPKHLSSVTIRPQRQKTIRRAISATL